jgi:CHAT domain-containing protein
LDIQAPELIGIPWELLRDDQQFLVRRVVFIVRFIDNARKDDVTLDFKNIKVLIVSASPTDNSFNESAYIQPVGELFQQYGIQPDILRGEQATRSNLQRILDENKYDWFHFVGHGTFAKDNGKVWVINQEGNSEPIRGNDLSDWLWDSGVKFAFFCSCQTGITSQENTFNGVAHSLVGRGIPAVVAMQYNFPQQEAKVFVESFYDKLLKSENIDEAMRFARNRLPHGEVSWCIPVLYSQFNIGKLITNPQPHISSTLTSQDIECLENLLVKSGFCELDQRRTLCYKISIDPDSLNFFNNTNNMSFANLLVHYLVTTDKKESLRLLCAKLLKVFQGGEMAECLKSIIGKLG